MLSSSAALVAVCAGSSGCGSTVQPAKLTTSQVQRSLAGSPGPLAALHAQADQLLGGGRAAFRARLLALRGYPVVVNKWASWCGPCKSEFPVFQVVGARDGRQVAFVGVNGKQDTRTDAAAFLKSFPVTYPSYFDPGDDIARTIQAAGYDPLTVFVDRSGRIQFVHAGPYLDVASLERDIRRYAMR